MAEGEKEVTIYYTDPATGVRCRVRIDLLHPEFVFDLKTALSVVQSEWLRQALRLDYDLHVLARRVPLVRQAIPPALRVHRRREHQSSQCGAFTAGESFLTKGGRKYQEAIGAYAACSKVNHWPDLGEEATLELEHWMASSAANEPAWRTQLGNP